MEERETYSTIKAWFLDCVFDTCLNNWNDETWPYSSIIAFTYEEYSASYNSVIENLMLNVVTLIMTGGWDLEQASYYKKLIKNILSQYTLEELLKDIPKEEFDEFIHDLKKLNLLNE